MKLLEIRKSKNEPFHIARFQQDDSEVFAIILGKAKLETKCKSFEQTEKWLSTKPYSVLFMICEEIINFLNKKDNGNN